MAQEVEDGVFVATDATHPFLHEEVQVIVNDLEKLIPQKAIDIARSHIEDKPKQTVSFFQGVLTPNLKWNRDVAKHSLGVFIRVTFQEGSHDFLQDFDEVHFSYTIPKMVALPRKRIGVFRYEGDVSALCEWTRMGHVVDIIGTSLTEAQIRQVNHASYLAHDTEGIFSNITLIGKSRFTTMVQLVDAIHDERRILVLLHARNSPLARLLEKSGDNAVLWRVWCMLSQ